MPRADTGAREPQDLATYLRRVADLWQPGAVFAPDVLCEAADALTASDLAHLVVSEQAEDDGLWFAAQTASEAYLQQELRRLHAAVEASDA